jgi:hypothetical protein
MIYCRVLKALPRNQNIARGARKKSQTYDLLHHYYPCPGLFLHHHCGFAAERQERRYLRGVRRTGQPDRLRSTRRSQCTFQGDYLVCHRVYDYIHHLVGLCSQARWTNLGPARLEVSTRQDAARTGSDSSASATEIDAPQRVGFPPSLDLDLRFSCRIADPL